MNQDPLGGRHNFLLLVLASSCVIYFADKLNVKVF